MRSGAIIHYPEGLKERQRPRQLAVGPNDTEEAEVLAVTYDAQADVDKWAEGPYHVPR